MADTQNKNNLKLSRVNTALILNVCSIFICYFIGLGFFTAILSLFLLKKDQKTLANSSNLSNVKSFKIAKLTAWIALIINLIYLLVWIWIIYKIGWNNITNPEIMNDSNFIKKALK